MQMQMRWWTLRDEGFKKQIMLRNSSDQHSTVQLHWSCAMKLPTTSFSTGLVAKRRILRHDATDPGIENEKEIRI